MMYWNILLADASAPATAAPAAPATSSTTQAVPSGQPSQPQSLFANPLFMFIPLALILYFMMIRPQSQQRKQMAKLLAALKSGDKVVTSSGIVGVIITVKDKTVSLRSADAKMEVTKSSITEILESSDSTQTSP